MSDLVEGCHRSLAKLPATALRIMYQMPLIRFKLSISYNLFIECFHLLCSACQTRLHSPCNGGALQRSCNKVNNILPQGSRDLLQAFQDLIHI